VNLKAGNLICAEQCGPMGASFRAIKQAALDNSTGTSFCRRNEVTPPEDLVAISAN